MTYEGLTNDVTETVNGNVSVTSFTDHPSTINNVEE